MNFNHIAGAPIVEILFQVKWSRVTLLIIGAFSRPKHLHNLQVFLEYCTSISILRGSSHWVVRIFETQGIYFNCATKEHWDGIIVSVVLLQHTTIWCKNMNHRMTRQRNIVREDTHFQFSQHWPFTCTFTFWKLYKYIMHF